MSNKLKMINQDNRSLDVCTEIWSERVRQMDVEGWTYEHDDVHSAGEMADAASCYASSPLVRNQVRPVPGSWVHMGYCVHNLVWIDLERGR